MLKPRPIDWVRSLLRRFGVDLVRYDHVHAPPLRRKRLLADQAIDLVLDVGANVGQFAGRMRELGYAGRLVSFEPQRAAFAELSRISAADSRWECRPLALGDKDGEATIHLSANSWSSSLLPIGERHVASAPDSAYAGEETVPVRRLDAIEGLVTGNERIYLKLDTQGFELPVLVGAQGILPHVKVIETELSLVSLYEGQALLPEVIAHLQGAGYDLVALDPAFVEARTGHVLQMDGIFVRRP